MSRNIVARGKFSDPRHIELTEPVPEIQGEIEVSIRQLPKVQTSDVFEIIAAFAPGSRSKAEIDQQIHEERDSWDNR
jgi:rubrerythrin